MSFTRKEFFEVVIKLQLQCTVTKKERKDEEQQ